MAPKAGVSHAQKLEKILKYFRQSGTCHTLKDLESSLPSVAGVHKMAIKDLVKDLMDDSKVKVEKIGSGNWYWCWAGEEARNKKNMVAQLESEKIKLEASNAALQERVERLQEAQLETQADSTHQKYLNQLGPLEAEVKRLVAEKDAWENAVAGGVEGMREDIAKLKQETSETVDNTNTVESQFQSMFPEAMDAIRRECYGRHYVDGEGLAEIEGL